MRVRWLLVTWLVAWAAFSVPWTSVTSTPHWDRARPPRIRSTSRLRPDHVLNVLFYLPATPLVAALGYPISAGLIAGAALSLTAEALQLFSVTRAPDGNDLIANMGGTAFGAVGVWLYRRRRLAVQRRRMRPDTAACHRTQR
jgi:VanZ family protein